MTGPFGRRLTRALVGCGLLATCLSCAAQPAPGAGQRPTSVAIGSTAPPDAGEQLGFNWVLARDRSPAPVTDTVPLTYDWPTNCSVTLIDRYLVPGQQKSYRYTMRLGDRASSAPSGAPTSVATSSDMTSSDRTSSDMAISFDVVQELDVDSGFSPDIASDWRDLGVVLRPDIVVSADGAYRRAINVLLSVQDANVVAEYGTVENLDSRDVAGISARALVLTWEPWVQVWRLFATTDGQRHELASNPGIQAWFDTLGAYPDGQVQMRLSQIASGSAARRVYTDDKPLIVEHSWVESEFADFADGEVIDQYEVITDPATLRPSQASIRQTIRVVHKSGRVSQRWAEHRIWFNWPESTCA